MKIVRTLIHITRYIPCLSLLILLIAPFQTRAQKVKKEKTYLVVVHFFDGTKTKGILLNVNDSSFELRNYPKSNKKQIIKDAQIVEVSTIVSLRLRKKEALGNSILIGTFSGFLVGFGAGKILFPIEQDVWFSYEFSSLYTGIATAAGGLLGGVIGAWVGTGKTYIINGDQVAFNQIKDTLRQVQLLPEVSEYP